MIVIVDYGMGNLGSILNMLKRIGCPLDQARASHDPQEIAAASKLILPGVGAFDSGMARLRELGLVELLNQRVLADRVPVLGVCLGMQLLTKGSEEGSLPGLGWIDGETVRFRFSTDPALQAGGTPAQAALKVPHMGWNTVQLEREGSLLAGMDPDMRFYFVHSYHVVCHQAEDILATTEYGYRFVSVLQRGNVMGAQFHPEKSHKFGMRLLKNFWELA